MESTKKRLRCGALKTSSSSSPSTQPTRPQGIDTLLGVSHDGIFVENDHSAATGTANDTDVGTVAMATTLTNDTSSNATTHINTNTNTNTITNHNKNNANTPIESLDTELQCMEEIDDINVAWQGGNRRERWTPTWTSTNQQHTMKHDDAHTAKMYTEQCNEQNMNTNISTNTNINTNTNTNINTNTNKLPLLCSMQTMFEATVDSDTLEAMFEREQHAQPDAGYWQQQTHIEGNMMPVLLDWMMEVCQEFMLSRETFHLAANYLNRYVAKSPSKEQNEQGHQQLSQQEPLSQQQQLSQQENTSHFADPNRCIHKGNFQLVGITCLYLAAKLEEIYAPSAEDFAITTDGAFNARRIESMERSILKTLNWSLHVPTPFSWLKMLVKLVATRLLEECQYRHAQLKEAGAPETLSQALQNHFETVCQVLLSVEMFERAITLIDITVFDVKFLRFYPSAIATSAFLLIYHFYYNHHAYHDSSSSNETLRNHIQQCFDFPLVRYIEELTSYNLDVLRDLIAAMEPLITIAFRKPRRSRPLPPKRQLDELRVPQTELYARQSHYPQLLQMLQNKPQQLKLGE